MTQKNDINDINDSNEADATQEIREGIGSSMKFIRGLWRPPVDMMKPNAGKDRGQVLAVQEEQKSRPNPEHAMDNGPSTKIEEPIPEFVQGAEERQDKELTGGRRSG
ncbi:hypothetical protein RLOatenuis_2670 [Rickettsiales bacterium]|nr:hypothetical protein RLOatenuis_2670 [Rickettsiales bacterium]